MNCKYIEEKNKTETIICYVASIVLLAVAILGNTKSSINQTKSASDLFSKEWFVSLIGIILADIFIIYCGKMIDKVRKNFKKWMSYLRYNGIKCDGYVKEIRYIKQNTYELKICYYSELQKNNITFYAPIMYITNLDKSKKILCSIYEIAECHKKEDYISEVIDINQDEHKISFSLNPFKLFNVVRKQYNTTWFGNMVALDFHYENE